MSTIPEDAIKSWEDLCIAWEESLYPKPMKSPYDVEDNCKLSTLQFTWIIYLAHRHIVLSAAEVRRELADDEEDQLANRGVALHKTCLAAFLILGLELEDA